MHYSSFWSMKSAEVLIAALIPFLYLWWGILQLIVRGWRLPAAGNLPSKVKAKKTVIQLKVPVNLH